MLVMTYDTGYGKIAGQRMNTFYTILSKPRAKASSYIPV